MIKANRLGKFVMHESDQLQSATVFVHIYAEGIAINEVFNFTLFVSVV